MSRKMRLRDYYVLIFIVVVVALIIFRGNIIGYLTGVPEAELVEVVEVNVENIVSSRGITYVQEEVIDKFSRSDTVRVIIRLKRDIDDLNLTRAEFQKKQKIRNFFSGELRSTGFVNLIDSWGDEIESIQVDHQLSFMLNQAVPKIRADLAWNSGLTGKGQTVCVIDTGTDYNHPDLSGKYIGGFDFVNNDFDPMDDHGHGTYISGIITGVAPDSKIIAAKALDRNGIGYESDIIAAIEYCIESRDLYNISVISMALGGGSFDGYCDAVLVTNESNYAAEQGIFVVAASGNDGSDNLTAPACGTNVTSVGATEMDDSVYSLTNINPLLDLLAPGVNINSTKLGGGFETASGTSASAAVVAGAAMLVLENESLEPHELEYRFRATGFVIEHDGTNYSRVDVYNALINNVTNTPSEQVGNQSEGSWEEYGPLAPACDCCSVSDCPGYDDCNLEACDMGYCNCQSGYCPSHYSGYCCYDAGTPCGGSNAMCCSMSCTYK
jgi:subtilisin family serine protease